MHSSIDLCRDRPLTVIIPSGRAASVVTTYRTSPPACGFILLPFSARVMPDNSGVAMLDNCQHYRMLRRQPLSRLPCRHELTAVESSSSRNLCQQSVTGTPRVFRLSRPSSRRFLTCEDTWGHFRQLVYRIRGQPYVLDRLLDRCRQLATAPATSRRDAPCGASLRANRSASLPDSLSLRCCAPVEEQPNPLGAGQILCRAESAAAAS